MSDNLLNDLEKFKSTYYADNKKNSVFKAAQKTDLANRVCEQFGLTELFKRTSFIIPGTNKVYINYPTLKTFVNASNYEEFAGYTQSLFLCCMQRYGYYECHVNLDTLTISAVERHRKLVEIFARDPVEHGGIEYTKFLSKAFIYNTPGLIDNITKILSVFLEKELLDKVIRYNKAETSLKLSELLR
jgi:hypothetical protein